MKTQNAVEKFATFRAKSHPKSTLAELKAANATALTNMGKITEGIYPKSDRERINEFLTTLEFNDEDTDHVMQCCATDPSARRYWKSRAAGIEPEVEIIEGERK